MKPVAVLLILSLLGCSSGSAPRVAFSVALAADLGTTRHNLSHGATEKNPTATAMGSPEGVALGVSAALVLLAELIAPNSPKTARWMYWAAAAGHGGAAAWNAAQR